MRLSYEAGGARSSLATILALAIVVQPALAAVPGYINYQARLTNASGLPLEGTQTLTFKFFDSQGSVSPLATETLAANASKGLISVQIPALASLFSAAERWLEVSVGGEALLPRTRLAAAPYAFKAAEADSAASATSATDSTKVLKAGDTMTGTLTLNNSDPYHGVDINQAGLLNANQHALFVHSDSAQTNAFMKFEMTNPAASAALLQIKNHGTGPSVQVLDSTNLPANSPFRVDGSGRVHSATQPRCRIRNNFNQPIANDSETVITFDTEDFDNANMHSPTTNPSRITIPAGGDGLYLIEGSLAWPIDQAAGGTIRQASVKMNGGTWLLYELRPAGLSAAKIPFQTIMEMGAGQYVELLAYQDSGGTKFVRGDTGCCDSTHLSVTKMW